MRRVADRLVIAGVGLIGGSLAMALRARGAVGEVVGFGRSAENLRVARRRGIIDRAERKDRGYRVVDPKSVARLMATYDLATSDQIDTFIRVWGEFRL